MIEAIDFFEMLKTAVCVVLVAVLTYKIWKSRESPQPQRYRNGSFAPVRNSSRAKWFVDGEDYMSAVADAIESAKYEILITAWQMNPYIFMKRPETGVNSSKWRLGQMLLRKADEGVRVHILLYWETKIAMDLGSNHTQTVLEQHDNIEVHRHPDWLNVAAYPKALMRWSHHEKMVIVDRKIAFVGGIDLCYGRWDTHSHELMDDYPTHPCAVKEEGECVQGSQDTRYSRWIGKDYRNTFFNNESETNWEKPFDDYEGFNRSHVPRMPWHDVACAFTGVAVSDAVEHFTQRYNALNPRFSFKKIFDFSWWKNWGFLHLLQPFEQGKNDHILVDASAYDVSVQVLRSVDGWSAGQPHEASIYNAYLHAIENAEHFIYIENQFFISSQDGFWRKVQNKIQSALVDRIVRAHEAGDNFYVIIVLPLKPEFAGDWDSDSASADALRAISYWNYATICNGEDSMLKRLEKRNVPKSEIQNYFSVFGLRTHGLLKGNFVTEIIYVHSKVMIVDDRLAIIGSANINDRSMLGERDSEVAVIVEDAEMIDGKMNGKPYQVGKFSHSLRCHLVKEHMGLLGDDDKDSEINVEDPLELSFLGPIITRAMWNDVYYKDAFGPGLLPVNGIENFDELRKQEQTPMPLEDTAESRELLAKIQGNMVTYACSFLIKELKPPLWHIFALGSCLPLVQV